MMEGNNQNSLNAQIRPHSLDVKGQQPYLFPFDAWEFDDPNRTTAPEIRLKEPWVLKAGSISFEDLDDDLGLTIETASIKAEQNELRISNSDGNILLQGQSIEIQGEQIDIVAGDLTDLAGDVATNTASISLNADEIALNVTAIGVNESSILDNTGSINDNAGAITTNTADIIINSDQIGLNVTSITTQGEEISDNEDAIAAQSTLITENTAAITLNSDEIDLRVTAKNAAGVVLENAAITMSTDGTKITNNLESISFDPEGTEGWQLTEDGDAIVKSLRVRGYTMPDTGTEYKVKVVTTPTADDEYATLGDALEAVSQSMMSFVDGGVEVVIEYGTGYEIDELTTISNVNLGWVTITSVDATVDCTTGFMYLDEGAISPQIDFSIDYTGASTDLFLEAYGGSYCTIGSGVSVTSFYQGIDIDEASTVQYGSLTIDSRIQIDGGSLLVGGGISSSATLYLDDNSNCTISSFTSTDGGIGVTDGSRANIKTLDLTDSSTTTSTIILRYGGSLVSENITVAGGHTGMYIEDSFLQAYGTVDISGVASYGMNCIRSIVTMNDVIVDDAPTIGLWFKTTTAMVESLTHTEESVGVVVVDNGSVVSFNYMDADNDSDEIIRVQGGSRCTVTEYDLDTIGSNYDFQILEGSTLSTQNMLSATTTYYCNITAHSLRADGIWFAQT